MRSAKYHLNRVADVLFLSILFCLCGSKAQAQYSGGTGDPDDPYKIASTEDLILLGETPQDYGKHFVLTADIDLNPNLPGRRIFDHAVIARDLESGGNVSDYQGTSFTGVFDGSGHTISHLTIEGVSFLGLFGVVKPEAVIMNLGLDDVNINGSGIYCGALAAYSYGSITMTYSTGLVASERVVGGLVGWNKQGSITKSYSLCIVAGETYIGGLVGWNTGDVGVSYSTGFVEGPEEVGGLVGEGDPKSVRLCYWDVLTSGQDSSDGGLGMTTEQMKRVETFSNWEDCKNVRVWKMDQGGDYPRLSWEDGPGDLLMPGLSDILEGEGSPNSPYLIYSYEDINAIVEYPCIEEEHFKIAFLSGNGTAEDPYLISTVDGLTLLKACPYEQDAQFRLDFLSGKGTPDDPYIVHTSEDLDLLAQCPYEQEREFRLGFLSGQGTRREPYIINTLKDLDLLSECPYEQDKEFRLGFVSGQGTSGYPYVIVRAEDLALLAQCPYEQDKSFRLGFLQGAGTLDEPYQIEGPEAFDLLSRCPYELDKQFELTNDIDLSGGIYERALIAADQNDLMGGFQGMPFTGVLDGRGHVISHLTIDGSEFLGLFGQLAFGANVHDLRLEAVDVNGIGGTIGAVAGRNGGWNEGGVVSDCHGNGKVCGGSWDVGGLVGSNAGQLRSSSFEGTVAGTDYAGGLVGWHDQGFISQSHSTAVVTGRDVIGGLVGGNAGSIVMSMSSGTVTSTGWDTGGLVGRNGFLGATGGSLGGTIRNCYSVATVAGRDTVGGLVGYQHEGSIEMSYSTGAVTGEAYLGGLIGYGESIADLTSNLWNIETSGQAVSDGGVGKTAQEMVSVTMFLDAGWDFINETDNGTEDVWKMWDGYDTPRLVWEAGPNTPLVFVDINDPGVPGHEGFIGQMSRYETTNAQYCEYLNRALTEGLITVYNNRVYAAGDSSHSELFFLAYGANAASQITYDGTFNVRTRDGHSMANHPVVYVSWYGATAFCHYYGYRLPTEWEWQAVADYDGTYTYGCGTTIDQTKANYNDYGYANPLGLTSGPYSSPVGYYSAYGYGMCDMAGNVVELTDSGQGSCVLRGGHWGLGLFNCTVSAGNGNDVSLDSKSSVSGFRACR